MPNFRGNLLRIIQRAALVLAVAAAAGAPCAALAAPPAPSAMGATKGPKARYFDWLDVRKGGYVGILAAARAAHAGVAWSAEYAAPKDVVPGLQAIRFVRLPDAQAKRGPVGDWTVQFVGDASWQRTGIFVRGGEVWMRLPGWSAARLAKPEELFVPIAGLGVPPIAFVLSEVTDRFEGALEGEFGSIALLRMRPRYELGPGLSPCKLGVSKFSGSFASAELMSLDGKAQGGVVWINEGELVPGSKQPGFAQLRVVPLEGKGKPFFMARRAPLVGKAVLALPHGLAIFK